MAGQAPMSRTEFMAAMLFTLTPYWLGLRCGEGCNKVVLVPLKLMAARLRQARPGEGRGRRMRLHEVLDRLRCEHCERGPVAAWLTDYPIDGHYGAHNATWRVELMP
jgi:hypothetical protein